MRCVLLTGAAGRIGSVLREGLRGRVGTLRLLDHQPLGEPAPGEKLYQADIVGTHNVFEAARRRGRPRVVYASSCRVIGFYPRGQRIDPRCRSAPTPTTG